MKKFPLPTTIAAAITTACLFSTQPANAEKVMHMANWLSPNHTMSTNVIPTWGKWIEAATDGRVTLKIETGVGHPKSMLDFVQDGVVDAAWTFHGYIPGRFKLTQMAELPGLGANAEAASVAYWKVHQKYLAKANEHDGVHLAALFVHGPGQIHMREPISTLAELQGKKVRIGGGVMGKIAAMLGIEGVSAPGSKVYEILSQGVADGVFMPMETKQSLRIKEVAPFTMKMPQGMYLGSFAAFISNDFLDSLEPKDKQAIIKVSGEKLSQMAGQYWADADSKGEDGAKAFGNTIIDASLVEQKKFNAMVANMDQEWIDSVSDRGVDAKAALMMFRETARSYKRHNL